MLFFVSRLSVVLKNNMAKTISGMVFSMHFVAAFDLAQRIATVALVPAQMLNQAELYTSGQNEKQNLCEQVLIPECIAFVLRKYRRIHPGSVCHPLFQRHPVARSRHPDADSMPVDFLRRYHNLYQFSRTGVVRTSETVQRQRTALHSRTVCLLRCAVPLQLTDHLQLCISPVHLGMHHSDIPALLLLSLQDFLFPWTNSGSAIIPKALCYAGTN